MGALMDYDAFCQTCNAYLGTMEDDPQDYGDIIECESCDPQIGQPVQELEELED